MLFGIKFVGWADDRKPNRIMAKCWASCRQPNLQNTKKSTI